MSKFLKPVVGFLLAAPLIAGCGGVAQRQAGPAEERIAVVAGPFGKLRGDDLGTIELAQRTVRDQCLLAAGFSQNVDVGDRVRRNPLGPLLLSATGFEPRTEAEARARGFGISTRVEPARLVSFDARYDKAFDRCAREAWAALGSGAERAYQRYVGVVNKVMAGFGDEVARRRNRQIPGLMATCMSSAGFPPGNRAEFLRAPDPAARFGVPLGRLSGSPDAWQPDPARGGVQVGPPVAARSYVPTEAESDLAVAWWRCSRRTGRTADFRAASTAAQQSLMTRHASELADLDGAFGKAARRAAELLRD